MFLASTRCALIACRYLAQGYNEHRYVSASEIAERYNINVRALLPALRRLVQAGLLRSRRGSQGSGFIFSRNPSEISLWEIVSALEGELHMSCCMEVLGSDCNCDCSSDRQCKLNSIFNNGFSQIKRDLQGVSVIQYSDIK